jgi:8-oxo-dGTP diphosphatase
MKNYPKVGIGVLIFKGRQLLLGKRQKAHGAYSWGPPGGHLEFGESFETCALREVEEETGLLLSEVHFTEVTNDIFVEDDKHYVSIFVRAVCPEGQAVQNREPEKTALWEWFDLHDLPAELFLPLRNLLARKGRDFLGTLAV